MKKTNKNTTLTPEQYIHQKARTLPLGQCYMNKDWFISGIAVAVVCRCHKMGTYTFGVFQFDTFCSGLIDCKVEFSRDADTYTNFINYLKNEFKIEPVTYQEAHNLIFGAIAFGEDAGFTPSPMFNLAKYVLEEDTEDIPLINYQFGRFGKHFLLADDEQELDEYMPHLIAHLGKENIVFSINGSDRYFKGEDFYDSETREVMRQIAQKIRQQEEMPLEEYSYVHPDYPTELKVTHEKVRELVYAPANRLHLSDKQIDELLKLPHDEVRNDLLQILNYEMGLLCNQLPTIDPTTTNSAVVHALILLKELGNAESLPIVLETLKQHKRFYDYHLSIIINEIYVPTLYKLGREQLDKFYEFLQIPGLYTYARYLIFPTVLQIAEKEPERKAEVIEWFRKVLQFYTANIANHHCCDGTLVGLMIADLIKLQAEELLPEVKAMFETGKVNTQCCGDYRNFETMIKRPNSYAIQYQYDVHQHYAYLKENRDLFITSQNRVLEELMNKAEELKNKAEELMNKAVEVEQEVPAEKEETTKETTTATKETTDKKEATKKAAAKKDSEVETTETAEKKSTTKKASTKKTTAKKTDADKETDATQTSTKKEASTTTKKAVTKKGTTKKETAKKPATKKPTTPKAATAKKATTKKDNEEEIIK